MFLKKNKKEEPISSRPNPAQKAEQLALYFAKKGDEEGTMLGTALMKGIVLQREKEILQICANNKKD